MLAGTRDLRAEERETRALSPQAFPRCAVTWITSTTPIRAVSTFTKPRLLFKQATDLFASMI